MWSMRDDGVVVGSMASPGARYLRQEISSLQALLRARQESAPMARPFGDEIEISVTVAPPNDKRLRALLTHFIGGHEPDWVWRFYEHDLWCYLLACAEAADNSRWHSGEDAKVHVELRDEHAREAFFQTTRAIAAVADHRIASETESELREQLQTAHRWFCRLGDRLAALSCDDGS